MIARRCAGRRASTIRKQPPKVSLLPLADVWTHIHVACVRVAHRHQRTRVAIARCSRTRCRRHRPRFDKSSTATKRVTRVLTFSAKEKAPRFSVAFAPTNAGEGNIFIAPTAFYASTAKTDDDLCPRFSGVVNLPWARLAFSRLRLLPITCSFWTISLCCVQSRLPDSFQ